MCTNEGPVVEYWNNIDKEIELEMDVIDDLVGEALEIHKFNKWLTYGQPMHRFREFGATIKEMDVIDEATLGKEQMNTICAHL